MKTTQANNSYKNKSNILIQQVIKLLHSKGLSKVYNNTDFEYFKRLCKNSFNKAQSISEMFVKEYQHESDFNQYIF